MAAIKNKPTEKEIIFAKKLRRIREYLGLSRPKFAELVELPPTTLKNYELCYRTSIPASLLQRMFNNQNLSHFVNYLLKDDLPVEYLQISKG